MTSKTVISAYHGGFWEKPLLPDDRPYTQLKLPDEGIQAIFLSSNPGVCEYFSNDRNPDPETCREVVFKARVSVANPLVITFDIERPYAEINGEKYPLSNEFSERERLYSAASAAGYDAVILEDHYVVNGDHGFEKGSDVAVFDPAAIELISVSIKQPDMSWTQSMPVQEAADRMQAWIWDEDALEALPEDTDKVQYDCDLAISY